MTISSNLRRAGPYSGNGSATAFPFDFKVFTKSDVLVTLTSSTGIESTLVLDSDYTVTLSSDQDSQPGGTVTYPVSGAPLPTGLKLTFSGNLPYSQPTDIQNSGGFYPQVVEDALDRLTIQTQQLVEEMSRTVKVGISDPTPPDELFASVLARADASANAAATSAAASATAEDGAEAAAQLAMDWATKMSGPVAAGQYSSQYYAMLASTAQKWGTRGIGEIVAIWDHLTGADAPPTNDPSIRYIKLTAADAYNTGVLTSESVSGVAPLVVATAVISLAGSPLNGATVNLINTERRVLRAGSSGVTESDQFQGFLIGDGSSFLTRLTSITYGAGGTATAHLGGTGPLVRMNDGTNGAPRAGTETRAKNIGATYYMRIR